MGRQERKKIKKKATRVSARVALRGNALSNQFGSISLTWAAFFDQGTIKNKAIYLTENKALRQALRLSAGKEDELLKKSDADHEIIFVKWFKHWKTGKIIYAKNGKAIPIRVRRKR